MYGSIVKFGDGEACTVLATEAVRCRLRIPTQVQEWACPLPQDIDYGAGYLCH